MIDVFMLVMQYEIPLRTEMSYLCSERWEMEECNFRGVRGVGSIKFHIDVKCYAEVYSVGDIYVVADDDCLILGVDFVKRGVEIMKKYPEYGLLAAANICEGDFRINWQDMPEVVPCDIVGGVAFVRKGILKEFKPCTPPEVDRVICDEIRSRGYKTGVMPSVRFNHIGAGYSISNPNLWMSVPS